MGSASQSPWEPVRKIRAYEQVMEQIEQRMLDGLLAPGDRLPGERELSQLLGVSRPSLREALRVLEALGIVEVRVGRGPDGGTVFVGTPGSGFANLLRMQLALGHFGDGDVLRTRSMLEEWAIVEASAHAGEQDFRELEALLGEMDAPELTARGFNRLDTEFHVRLTEATGNALASYLMSSLRMAIQRNMIEAYEKLPDWRRTARSVQEEHRAILQAVRTGDTQRGVELVRRHIIDFYAVGRP